MVYIIGLLFVFSLVPISFGQKDIAVDINSANAQSVTGQVAQFLGAPALCGGGVGTVFTGSGGSIHRCTLSDVSAQCQQSPSATGNCTTEDQGILSLISTCSSGASAWSWSGSSYGCSASQTQQSAQASQILKQVPTCSLNNFSFNKCLFVPLLESLGSWFVTIGAYILSIAGALFDTVINVVIVGFGSTLSTLGLTSTNGAINSGWDAFRDLANILIIGMFVFIAISTILGSKEYGYKKLVARVLVIAVLMNFSLLFTKLIIDASNFTAYQFYSQIAGQGTSGNVAVFDTAGSFLKPIGITSIWNDSQNLGDAVGQTTGSAMQAFAVGLVGGILLVAIAAVLFYGTILIAARGVVLVVLMVTSAVAFATYLLPNFAGSKYGWKGWWEALINCAVFAPVLMLFLSLSLMILRNAPIPSSGNNLGTIIGNPAQLSASGNVGWEIIMTYIFTLGLLYVSLKISSTFASSTSGMNIGSMMSGLGSLSGIGAFAGRNTVSRFGLGMAESKAAQANTARDAQAKAERQARIHSANGRDDLANIAKTEADRQRKIAAKSIMSAGRYSGIADAKFGGKPGLKSRIDAKGAEGAKLAQKLAPDKEARDKVREEAQKEVTDLRKGEQGKLETETGTSKASMDSLTKVVKEQEESMKAANGELANAMKAATEKKSSTQGDHDAIIAELSKKIAEKTASGTPAGTAEADILKEQRQRRLSDRAAQFKTEDDRINNAKLKIAEIGPTLESANKAVEAAKVQSDGIAKKLADFKAETDKIATKAGQDAVAGLTNSASAVAGEIAVRKTGFVNRTIGAVTGDNDKVRHAAMHKFGHAQSKDASLKKIFQEAAKEDEAAH
jgi:hypothetical protein